MGMSHCSTNSACVVKIEFIKKICSSEYQGLLVALKDAKYHLENFAEAIKYYGDDDDNIRMEMDYEVDNKTKIDAVLEAYYTLCNVFKKKTNLGLNLMYHELQYDGDEVDGAFWVLDGVFIVSPAAKKIQDQWEQKEWTEYE